MGLRPTSHECVGLAVPSQWVSWLPGGNIDLELFSIELAYVVSDEALDGDRSYCLGLDLWYGEFRG